MAYVPTTFVDRSVEFPNRRKFTAVSGQADTFDVARAEGTVFAEGTKPDAANLNAEFGKIKTETDSINNNLSKCTIGTRVNISSYNTKNNIYTCQSDGYIIIECVIGTSNQSILMTDNDVIVAVARSNGALNGSSTVYVRRGMKFYISGTNYSGYFLPIN